jgi:hypothetical protein
LPDTFSSVIFKYLRVVLSGQCREDLRVEQYAILGGVTLVGVALTAGAEMALVSHGATSASLR